MPRERESARHRAKLPFQRPALQGVLLRPAALGTEGQLREEPRGAPQDPAQGSSLEALAAFDVASVCTHADNYPMKSLKGKTPYALAVGLVPKRLLDKLGISRLRADGGRPEAEPARHQATLVYRRRKDIAPGHIESPSRRCAWSFENRRKARASMLENRRQRGIPAPRGRGLARKRNDSRLDPCSSGRGKRKRCAWSRSVSFRTLINPYQAIFSGSPFRSLHCALFGKM